MCVTATALPAVANGSSIQDLIKTIPRPYRPTLGRYVAERYWRVRNRTRVARTLSSLRRHLQQGTFPMSIRNALKVPILSINDEFTMTADYNTTMFALHAGVHAARRSALQAIITQATAELTFLSSRANLDTTKWERDWKRFVTVTAASLVQAYGGSLGRNAQGTYILLGMPAEAQTDFSTILGASAMYATRLLRLAQANFGPSAR